MAATALCPVNAGADETFATVVDFGSSGKDSYFVGAEAAQGVAIRLNAQNPAFVLAIGDLGYGPFPVSQLNGKSFETAPLPPNSSSGYPTAVGALYGQYILKSTLVPNGGATMNFFPALGDHDWRHEQIQVSALTGQSINTDPNGAGDATGYVYNTNSPRPCGRIGESIG